MANASGRAIDGVIPADFRHPASGVRYRLYEEGGRVWLSYEREGGLNGSRAGDVGELDGRMELRYFIGSGKRGRTYLFEREGYWFEAPINWYAKKQIWDMAPNHLTDKEMPLTLPVDPGCLHCHASAAAPSLPDARNHYAGEPFSEGGITCAGCHGDGSAHASSGGKIPMLKLDNLEPVRRDSVCLNCHLEGEVAVDRAGRRVADFRPGDNLFDYSLFFVYRRELGSGGRATSQWEALLESECKKKSGERMTCTTCHDPHGSPSQEERIAYYRERCLNCHGKEGLNGADFGARHHPENPDCTACHMERATSTDIAHEQVTDHLIRKRLGRQPAIATGGELEPIGGGLPGDRDIGLAYAQMALRGDDGAAARAMELLRRGEQEAHGAYGDAELHEELGFLEQVKGDREKAAQEYERTVKANPYDAPALGDLGVIRARQHRYAQAERLWKAAFEHDPVQIGAGMDLAELECASGDRQGALATLARVLEFDPDDSKAKALAHQIRANRQCELRERQHSSGSG
jgi:predicted CXXCH cytochrome family protein